MGNGAYHRIGLAASLSSGYLMAVRQGRPTLIQPTQNALTTIAVQLSQFSHNHTTNLCRTVRDALSRDPRINYFATFNEMALWTRQLRDDPTKLTERQLHTLAQCYSAFVVASTQLT